MSEVAYADGAASHLVLVSGSDAPPRSADFAGARCILAQAIEVAVDGEDQRTGFSHPQHLGRDLDTLVPNALDLGLQGPGIEHHAVADH